MQVWIKCPQFHWIKARTTHRLMHEHVGKRAKRQRSKEIQTGGAKQAWQAYQHCTEWRKVYSKPINTTEVYLTNGHIQTSPRRDGCDHTSTSPQRAQSLAKPRSRVANIGIKRRSKQTNMDMCKGNDPNPLIQAQVCGCKPRPQDLDLPPTGRAKKQEKEISKDKNG